MKTKITLVLLLSFAITSCSKWQGSGSNGDVEPTYKNSIFEGNLYAVHLTFENQKLEERKKELNAIIKSNEGNENDKQELETITEKINLNLVELENVVNIDRFVRGRFGPIRPFPPCPKGKCDELPFGILNIISQSESGAEVTVRTIKGEQITKDRKPQPIGFAELSKTFNVQNVSELENYSGDVIIRVDRLNLEGERLTYELEGSIPK